MSDRFCFSWLDENIEIRCGNPSVAELLRLNFAVMAVGTTSAGIRYTVVERGGVPLGLYRDGSDRSLLVADTGELIFALESDLVVQLQLRRPERLFLHAAVLVKDGSAHLLAGRSGAGKPTTCWGLVRSGFEYSSDELAPIDINHMQVAAYPHAICLKSQPPADFPLPAPAVETARGYHIPAAGV